MNRNFYLIFFTLFVVIFCLPAIGSLPGHVGNDEIVRQKFPGEKSRWKGFERFDFQFQERACRIVCPEKPAEGNPWVWNARFPDWHVQMDSILLSRGFYITYLNTDELNGSPECVKIWDEYFNYLTKTFRFENSVALEGISRGGLFVYNFAKKYPWRVSCIYGEAPVCDFKSWPGGFGYGTGSPKDWLLIKKAYGFKDDAEAVSYKDNPVDNLEKLAAEKVPVLHMISLNDSVVPPAENTFVLINKYLGLGGLATVIPCTRGKQSLKGHHFDIETPALAADFIQSNTRAFRKKLPSGQFHIHRGNLTNSALRFEKEQKGTVAFLGGSITNMSGWRDSVCITIQKRFPGTAFAFINAGIPSLGSLPDAFRLFRDVISKGKVDLLFVEAAVNDQANGYPRTVQLRAMEGIVRHARRANPAMDIVFMYFVDPGKIADYNQGIIPGVILNHEKIAGYYQLPAVNLAKEVTERIYNKEFTWEGDFLNLHPSPFGQNIYHHSISCLLNNYWTPDKTEDKEVTDWTMPQAIDPFNYEYGSLIPVTVSDRENGWEFEQSWTPEDKASTRPDFVNVPMLVCTSPGKIKTFRFTGESAGVAVASGPDAGILEYCVDNREWQSIDLYTIWSKSLHLPWFLMLGDGLKTGSHTLKIRLSGEKNRASKGTACRLRYLLVNK